MKVLILLILISCEVNMTATNNHFMKVTAGNRGMVYMQVDGLTYEVFEGQTANFFEQDLNEVHLKASHDVFDVEFWRNGQLIIDKKGLDKFDFVHESEEIKEVKSVVKKVSKRK